MSEKLYHFECPECGFDDDEAKTFALERQVYCGICAGDTGRNVLLRRWPVDNDNDDLHFPKIANI